MSATSVPAIEIVGLRKQYGDQTVLDGIDLTVPAGTVTALLGPNGGPARRRSSRSCPPCCPQTAAPRGSWATTSPANRTSCDG